MSLRFGHNRIPIHGGGLAAAAWLILGLTGFVRGQEKQPPSSPAQRFQEIRQEHWAFQPVRRPVPPEVRDTSWPKNPIDHFILSRLEKSQLSPSPPADRPTLIRRAYIDLIGVPPGFEEVNGFQDDTSSEAFAKVVDRLLARPEYGERWARHWLDVARYADAKGYVDGGEARYPFAFTYRDYVVAAFNRDLPYDRFIMEQLAADKLPGAPGDQSKLAALGLIGVGSRFNFFPHEIIDDRIDVVTRGFLGLTVACARCHDHKFDPISSHDYYNLYGVFANTQEPSPDQWPRLSGLGVKEDDAFEKKLREAADEYREFRLKTQHSIMSEMRNWAGDYLRYIVQSNPRHRTQSQPEIRTERGLIREVSAYAGGAVLPWRRYLETRTPDDPVFGMWVRLGALAREEIPRQWNQERRAWLKMGIPNPLVMAAFAEKVGDSMADVADVYGTLLEATEEVWQQYLKTNPSASRLPDPAREQLRQALYGEDAPANVSLEESEDYYTLNESVAVRKRFADIERVFIESWQGVAPRPMLLQDRPHPVVPHVFLRGDSRRLGPLVERAIPAVLTGTGNHALEQGSGRLELAQSMASPQNPFTARVLVNRVWNWHFADGLVDTPSDFGLRSKAPSHPELLDFLAAWFMDHGWSLKKLHRMILLSQTWQQQSLDRPPCRKIDPDNQLFWRMNRQRLDFESMRDSMLAVSGQLDSTRGGPPVQKSPVDVSNRRRTLYTYVDREKLAEIYRVFDFPSPDITTPQRSRTTVAQQSLFFLNNPFVLAQAEAVVKLQGMSGEGYDRGMENVDESIQGLYRTILGRESEGGELALARDFIKQRHVALIHDEALNKDPWIELAQTLLISNEFLFLD